MLPALCLCVPPLRWSACVVMLCKVVWCGQGKGKWGGKRCVSWWWALPVSVAAHNSLVVASSLHGPALSSPPRVTVSTAPGSSRSSPPTSQEVHCMATAGVSPPP